MQQPIHDGGVDQNERAQPVQVTRADVREEWPQKENEARAPDARPIERSLETLSHGPLR